MDIYGSNYNRLISCYKTLQRGLFYLYATFVVGFFLIMFLNKMFAGALVVWCVCYMLVRVSVHLAELVIAAQNVSSKEVSS